jgi:hypothetical protein
MKKLIAICVIFGCLLTPLKGYGYETEDIILGVMTIGITIGATVFINHYYQKYDFPDNFIKARDNETNWTNKAWEFYCDAAQLSPGQAFVKYQRYLSVITNFLTKYPKHENFRNDLKSVFEMSQDDNRLTPKEKQEIVDKFASNYKFLISKKQAI